MPEESMRLSEALDALRDPDPVRRQQGAEVLRRLGGPAAIAALVGALRDPDARVWAAAEEALWQIWCRSGDPETDRLLSEGTLSMSARDFGRALAQFEAVIARAADFAEGYNKRATTYYLMGEHEKSIGDCDRTLALNPVHFGAMSGQGLCYLALRRLEQALDCFRRALAVHPHLAAVRDHAETVARTLRARDNGSR